MTENARGRKRSGAQEAWLRRLFRVEPGDGPLLILSAGYFFCLLLSYYILRPLRETAGIAGDDRVLHKLFFATFCVMLCAVPVYGAVVAHVRRVRFIACSTIFFASQLVLFALAFRTWPEEGVRIGRVFFVWLSVFNLFVVSIFWSLMVERWSLDSGKRLFGLIAAGGSLGGIIGSRVTALTAGRLSTEQLFLISAAVLLMTLFFLVGIVRRQPVAMTSRVDAEKPIGGGVFDGRHLVAHSPFLRRSADYLFILTLCGSFVYLIVSELVRGFSLADADRQRVFADINTVVTVLTLLLQLFGVSALMRGVGVGKTLGILPMIYLLGFIGFALVPFLAVISVFEIVRRSAGYGVTGPARDVLYTVVPREEKYKAKAFIDTVVHRGGDMAAAQLFALLAKYISVGTIAAITAPICVLWGWVALSLGRHLQSRSHAEGANRLETPLLKNPERATRRGPSPPSLE